MKNIYRIFTLVVVIELLTISCTKKTTDNETEDNKASYEFRINGDIISSNNDVPFGMLLDTNEKATHISVYEKDNSFGMGFSGMPVNVGASKPMNIDVAVSVNGSKIDNYTDSGWITIEAGTMTRTADNKVSFNGTFEYNGVVYQTSGFIKSNEMINH